MAFTVEVRNDQSGEWEKVVKGVGTTFAIYCDNSYRIMSDVYGWAVKAVYWNEDKGRPETVHLDSNEGYYSGPVSPKYGVVDATDDVKEKAIKYFLSQTLPEVKAEAEVEANRIERGCIARVARGRNIPKGLEGKVVGVISRTYGQGYYASERPKIGIATSDVMVEVERNGRKFMNHRDVVWVWAHNCDKVNPPSIDMAAVQEKALNKAKNHFERMMRDY